MNKSTKQVNGLFLSIILLYLGIVVLLSFLASYGIMMEKVFSLLIGEMLIAAPAILLLIWNRKEWREWIPLRRMRISSILLSVVFAYLLMPLAMLANAVSMVFVENETVTALRAMMGMPTVVLVLIIGIYGPLCEEIAFRGAIFGGYRKTGRVLAAAVLSSVLFGLMHLNGNQLGYAMILGFAFALLVEATGSIWSSFIAHAVINTHNTLMLVMSEEILKLADSQKALEEIAYTDNELLLMIGVLLPVAAFSTVLAAGTYILIARNEKRMEQVRAIFRKKQKPKLAEESEGEIVTEKPRFVTWSLVVAIIICFVIIFMIPLMS